MIENKAPGKDLSLEDIKEKIPLAAKKSDNDFSVVEIGGEKIGGEYFGVFAGPNMVESEELILEVAKNVGNSEQIF